jgi:hypothetical protein
MKNKHNSEDFVSGDFEWYEERSKGKIKRVRSDHEPKRETRNWKKAWTKHTDDYDEHDEFYGRK